MTQATESGHLAGDKSEPTNQAQKHSAFVWKHQGRRIYDEYGNIVAIAQVNKVFVADPIANAALIVEAVNSHTALTERVAKLESALQDAWAYMEHNNIQQFADRQGSIEQIAYCSVRAALTEAALKWIPASERLPDVKPNNYQEFNVAIRREHNGETYVISACYLNALMLLTSDDDCPEEGKPYTGWCKLMNDDGDFDTAWNYIENCGDKVTHWQPLPEPPAALVKP